MEDSKGARLHKFIDGILGKNQTEFAKLLGIHQPNINLMYFHDRPFDKFDKIIQKLGCNLEWLYDNKGDMFADNENGRYLKEKYEARIKEEQIQKEIDKNIYNLEKETEEKKRRDSNQALTEYIKKREYISAAKGSGIVDDDE
jgi:hypothetical protein